MRKKRFRFILITVLMLISLGIFTTDVHASKDPTQESGTKTIQCDACDGSGVCMECLGSKESCDSCKNSRQCTTCQGSGYIASPSKFYNTAWALLPPLIAIGLALLTKEVYSSLFIGIIVGGLLFANFSLEGTLLHVFNDGIANVLADSYNVGILVFLVILGTMVCLMNKAGGSAAFGRWAKEHVKSRVGAQLAVIILGCLIFIDDYFNCLTVGSVMRPLTDAHRISRAKLAYIIDATAAPICIIAPISSWAAAVAGFAEDGQGLSLFIQAIPYNFYALLTILMMVGLVLMKIDFGAMAKHERNAIKNNDVFSGESVYQQVEERFEDTNGMVLDLIFPILVLIVCCVIGMLYSGGFFRGVDFITAFSNSDASVGLMLGSAIALLITFLYYGLRKAMSFKEMMACLPEGFKAMVPAILILTFAWSLKAMTDSLGAKYFVRDLVVSGAQGMQMLLPALIFLIGCGLAFATGTSWGTFGILIPIVQSVFSMDQPLAIICISACMAGAVCGDHCSPISDTTIMASAGAQCDHVSHVSTQLPYALLCAGISFVTYILAGTLAYFDGPAILALPVGMSLMLGILFYLKRRYAKP
ncbi:Na+/H+ antiporter NhaC family protein [Amedibacillus dolichus]|uniref:Na+/H+ antiporter NhaC family protein n=1 Tax=Amedibacillus dolichus TaxID=31971 RepID=UPI001D02A06C|nr:Na+/H+ antiporter NhaC family protein [Amedibacillus dolichus]MCB5372443.1 Na+/H+ antiporter NhaC family protein [Amedibacillus dolichus]